MDSLEFNQSSSTDNQGRAQQAYQNNMISIPNSHVNVTAYSLCPGNTPTAQADGPTNESASLSVQNSGGSSSHGPSSEASKDATKVEHGWSVSLNLSSGVDTRLEDRGHEAPSIDFENMGMNMTGHHVDNAQSRALSFRLLNANPNSVRDAEGDGRICEFFGTDASFQQSSSSYSQHEQLAHSGIEPDPNRGSSICIRLQSEDSITSSGGTLVGRATYLKRKNIEGIAGPSSASGSSRTPYNNESSSHHPINACHYAATGLQSVNSPDTNIPGSIVSNQRLDQVSNTVTTQLAYSPYNSSSSTETAERSERNVRMRMNTASQNNIPSHNLRLQSTVNQHSTSLSSHQLPDTVTQFEFSQPMETRQAVPSTYTPSLPPFSVVPCLSRNVTPSSSGSSNASSSAGRVIVSREETSSRTITRNSIPDISLYSSSVDARQWLQDPLNRNLDGGGIFGSATSTSRSGNNAALNVSVAPSSALNHTGIQHNLILPELAHQGLSESHIQMRDSSLLLGHLVGPLSTHRPSSDDPANQQHIRSATVSDRQSNGVSNPLRSSAARERRRRMISEIREALDLLHSGENMRLQDVMFLDRSILHGFAERYDRHRDLRLDVDNMSYEELLALEERIGNVGTGLSEETIMKFLKQQQYLLPTALEANAVEPCCICQELYVKGDQLGKLDCGHDFHTACIKQWLTYKNLCPICKATALNS